MNSRGSRRPAASGLELEARRAVQARDAGLRRISAVTRWLAAGVVALSGALALIAAGGFRGHAVASSAALSVGSAAQTPTPSPASGVQAPSQAPVQTPAAPVVVSGGS
jgi:hypothetical protein